MRERRAVRVQAPGRAGVAGVTRLWVPVMRACVALTAWASPLAAQSWNDSTTLALIERGIAARQRAQPDASLQSYRTRAHGMVFFLAQAGRELDGPPRLVKADELAVEVYWRAPSTSKQVILGWRDGRWLPTDVNYHRDHLGIVTNNFGDRIRIGEGDEVRDVPHPLAPGAPDRYDYRLRDSVELRVRDAVLQLHEIEVRPRDPAEPRVVGTLSLDAATGDLVRFRFSFTPPSYLDHSLEDISVLLENAQVEGRWWLPWRQEIEIRRRVTWFDFPARTIIRGRWEIGEYDLNADVPRSALGGPAIGGLRKPDPGAFDWPGTLAEAVGDAARPVERRDLEQVRAEASRIVEGRMLSGLPRVRPGVSAISDLAHVNRVQGLALGIGAGFLPTREITIRPRVAYGTSDRRFLADLTFGWTRGATALTLAGGRRIRDLADQPVVSPLVNSLLAQEGGRDQGDYVLLDQARLGLSRELTGTVRLNLEAGVERSRSVSTTASPARGHYRPNPPLGAGTIGFGRLGFGYGAANLAGDRGANVTLDLEGGAGERDYGRAVLAATLLRPLGPGGTLLRLEGGAGSARLPPYRSFALGGWGTLPGEGFRTFGGRRYVLARLEYRVDAPFPALPLGAFVSTGERITLAPFLAAGWAGGGIAGTRWRPSGEIRPVAGLAAEWLHRLIRVEVGASLVTGNVGVSVDVSREWWDVL